MGTLSKRPLSDFGVDIKDRIEDFRSSVGGRIDRLQDDVRKGREVAATLPASTWFALAAGVVIGSLSTLVVMRSIAK